MNQPERKTSKIVLHLKLQQHTLVLSLPKTYTNLQLAQHVFSMKDLHQQHSPKGYIPVGIQSAVNNQMITYFLTLSDQSIGRMNQNQVLKVIYADPLMMSKRKNNQIILTDFDFLRCLGKGVSSEVYLVRHKLTCKMFAIKQIKKQYISDYRKLQNLLRQLKILKELPKTDLVINFHAAFQSQHHINILTDFYPGGELFFHMQNHKFSQQQSRQLFSQVLISLQFLHNQKILYRDLKPQNIVIDFKGHIRIADFGLSKCGFQQDSQANSYCGSPQYMAPQMISRMGYNYSVDFYTLGAILYQFVTGLPPFYSSDQQKIFSNITSKKLKVPEGVNQGLRTLLRKILQKNPENRISSFQQIKSNQWLKGVDWDKIVRRQSKPAFQLNLNKKYIHQEFYKLPVSKVNTFKTFERLFYFFDTIKQESISLFFPQRFSISLQNPKSNSSQSYSTSRHLPSDPSYSKIVKQSMVSEQVQRQQGRLVSHVTIVNHKLQRKNLNQFKLLQKKKSHSNINTLLSKKSSTSTIKPKFVESRENAKSIKVIPRQDKTIKQGKQNMHFTSSRLFPKANLLMNGQETNRSSRSKDQSKQAFRRKKEKVTIVARKQGKIRI